MMHARALPTILRLHTGVANCDWSVPMRKGLDFWSYTPKYRQPPGFCVTQAPHISKDKLDHI